MKNYLNKRITIATLPLILLLLAACTAGRVNNPEGWSAGAISGDTLYIGTREGDLRALDVNTGATKWNFDRLANDDITRAFYGSPVVADDIVYIGGYDGFVYAISDGELKGSWPEDRESPLGPIVGSLTLADDVLLVGSSDSNLYALEVSLEGGRLFFSVKWIFQSGDRIWSSPAVADGVVYLGSQDHNVYAVSLEDGSEIWKFSTRGSIVAKPLVAEGRVYIGSFDGIFYAIDASTGQQVWSFDEAANWYWGQALLDENTIYVASLDGNLYALDKNTGEKQWVLETEGAIVGTPVIVFDMIAVPSEDKRLHLARLKDGTKLDSCNIGEEIRTSLVERDGIIYLGATDNSIRALRIKTDGNPDEEWVHFTNEDDPLPRDRPPDC